MSKEAEIKKVFLSAEAFHETGKHLLRITKILLHTKGLTLSFLMKFSPEEIEKYLNRLVIMEGKL